MRAAWKSSYRLVLAAAWLVLAFLFWRRGDPLMFGWSAFAGGANFQWWIMGVKI